MYVDSLVVCKKTRTVTIFLLKAIYTQNGSENNKYISLSINSKTISLST